MTKKFYEAPALRAHGSIEKLTQGGSTGNNLDAAFPTGTPFSQITFS
ncbi:MAG: lasso RiPP family leader peptide-containing protein [Oxalobacteraceae bacterium]|nr:MAG: lasso RiPP family leader peptide-containing protein [Oxalobacteraceae bacterium]